MQGESLGTQEQSKTGDVLELTEKRLLRLREVVETLAHQLEVVMGFAEDEPKPAEQASEEGISVMRKRLKTHISDIDRLIDVVEKVLKRLEI